MNESMERKKYRARLGSDDDDDDGLVLEKYK